MLNPDVASLGDDRRTQNGHIRNDTRDVSRRIPTASMVSSRGGAAAATGAG
jgi:hypothetical protein